MRGRFMCIAFGALLLLAACREQAVPEGSWIPALEDTGFTYLQSTGEKLRGSLQTARENLTEGKTSAARQQLAEAEETGLSLLYYHVPITEVRQLIYDAGRLHALKRTSEVLVHLDRAEIILKRIGEFGGSSVQRATHETLVMIEDLRLTLTEEMHATSTKAPNERAETVVAKFRRLGHRVNMLAIKGDLILAGTHFAEEP